MNGLTDRLQMIADEIEAGETMADIGTDHGFLPIYLWENGISPAVIMCDISEPSLAKAKGAAGAYQFGNELDFRAGDGLKVLKCGETDAVVIAGMGGLLIRDILAGDMAKSLSFSKFVLQPRNNSGKLRYWLVTNGFEITNDQLVREGKFICEIITARPAASTVNCDTSDACSIPGEHSPYWELPNQIAFSQPELCAEFAAVKLNIEKKILAGMEHAKAADPEAAALVRKRIEYFASLKTLKGR